MAKQKEDLVIDDYWKKVVEAYNEFETAAITWTRKESRLKLYAKYMTPVTAGWIDEVFIISKKDSKNKTHITAEELKDMAVEMLEFDDFLRNYDESKLSEKDKEIFSPLLYDDDDDLLLYEDAEFYEDSETAN